MKKIRDLKPHDTWAYRTYLIRYDAIWRIYYISKGGHHIGSAKSLELAKKAIDQLV
jgi:hypothetical protein